MASKIVLIQLIKTPKMLLRKLTYTNFNYAGFSQLGDSSVRS